MDISWPVAAIVIVVLIFLSTIVMVNISSKAEVAKEVARGRDGEQYRMLAADYEKLARETRDATAAIRSDLATMLQRVDSIDRMMREVS
jgi:ribosome-binding protein aMBF1 (putative translation factor)